MCLQSHLEIQNEFGFRLVSSRSAANSHGQALLDGSVCDDASMRRICGEGNEDGGGDEGC